MRIPASPIIYFVYFLSICFQAIAAPSAISPAITPASPHFSAAISPARPCRYTPQTAASLGLSYNYNYWFIDADVEYFDRAYLDMNPLYRTDYAVAGLDNTITDEEVTYMTTQEKFKPAWLVNLSVGKSWYIQRKYQIGFSLNVKNILNDKGVKTGGYEQTRMVDNTASKSRYYRFDSKYFYMAGTNYMLNIYFRF